MEKEGQAAVSNSNWSEEVEDIVSLGATEAAIALLESTVSKLETQPSDSEIPQLQLASALTNLATLYSSKGFSLKSDQLLSRAFQIRYFICLILICDYSSYLCFFFPFSNLFVE